LDPAVDRARLPPREKKILTDCINGARKFSEVQRMSPISKGVTWRVLFGYYLMGAIGVSPKPYGGMAKTELERELDEEIMRLKNADPFSALGVHWLTHQQALDDRYKTVMNRYGADSAFRKNAPHLAGVMDCIVGGSSKAYEQIKTAEQRRNLRTEILNPDQQRRNTRLHFETGLHVILMQHDVRGSARYFLDALDVSPSDPYFQAGYGLWLCKAGQRGEGERFLRRALDIAPHNEEVKRIIAASKETPKKES
jgi:hypothetical protein